MDSISVLKSYKKIAILFLFILPSILLSLPGCDSSKTHSRPTAGTLIEASPTPSESASPAETSPTPTPVLTPTVAPSTSTPTPIGDNVDIAFQVAVSPAPKLGETAELVFSVLFPPNPIFHRIPDERSLVHSRAWVEFYWTNTQGSYSEAKKAVPVPLSEVLVSGDLSWEGNAGGMVGTGGTINLLSKVQLPREGVWKIKGFFSG